jgi:diguanylate cyclase (GGDEF)-like protein
LNISHERTQKSTATESPQSIIRSTLDIIQKSYDYDRLFIMKIDAASRRLLTVESLDNTPLGMDLFTLHIPLSNQAGGFVDCLRKKRAVVIKGGSPVEKKVLKFLQSKEIGLIPIEGNRKMIGLLCVDNALSGCPIESSALSPAAILINELGNALENLSAVHKDNDHQEPPNVALPVNQTEVKLAEAFKNARSGAGKLALALIEFDQFSEFAGSHGQQAHEAVFQLTGGTLQKLSRPTDVVGRWSQNRFLVILPNTTSSEVVPYGERICSELSHLGQLLTKRFPGQALTACVGLTAYDPTMSQPKDIYQQVAKALKIAQSEGPGTVRLYVTVY